MPIVVGIDGTNSSGTLTEQGIREYLQTYSNSFVSRLCGRNTGGAPPANKQYFIGPAISGLDLDNSISAGYRFILSRRNEVNKEPILLTGHSRGGLGVVRIAWMLKAADIPVKAMLLFDAVSMHPQHNTIMDPGGQVIPDKVAHVLHVRRSPDSGSRPSWGNTATVAEFPSSYQQAFFKCTHSAVGGVPWIAPPGTSPNAFVQETGSFAYRAPSPGFIPRLGNTPDMEGGWGTNVTYAEDRSVSDRVWLYVMPFAVTHGFL